MTEIPENVLDAALDFMNCGFREEACKILGLISYFTLLFSFELVTNML